MKGAVAAILALLAAACTAARPAPDPAVEDVPYRVVRPAVAFEMLRDNPGLLILDLRSPEDYAGPEGHLQRAFNLPLDQLEDAIAQLEPVRGRTFLVVCDDSPCGPRGLTLLREQGFDHAVLLAGGVSYWTQAGFGVVYGPHPEPVATSDDPADAATSSAQSKSTVDLSGPH